MNALRNFFRDQRLLVAVLIVLALAMKVFIPAGYMLDHTGAFPAVVICPDSGGPPPAKAAPHHMAGMHHDMAHSPEPAETGDDHDGKQDGRGACPFSVLPMTGLAVADAPLLATALAFLMVLGFAPVLTPRLARNLRLRPPMRGPPAHV